jgi:hypothetical protein
MLQCLMGQVVMVWLISANPATMYQTSQQDPVCHVAITIIFQDANSLNNRLGPEWPARISATTRNLSVAMAGLPPPCTTGNASRAGHLASAVAARTNSSAAR